MKYKELTEIKSQIEELEKSPSGSVSPKAIEDVKARITQVRNELNRLEFRYHMLLHYHRVKKARSERRLTELMERLRGYGFKVSGDEGLKKALESQAYRLMELVRSGRREEALYLLLRAYLAQGRSFPRPLIEAFLPIYSPEETKLLIFSYISGFIGQKTQ
ncbi:MAG: hypothetical protein N2253_09040 [Bacteroidia bacterium]|nr:hypothetical protein [Bacteroidia bacterium]